MRSSSSFVVGWLRNSSSARSSALRILSFLAIVLVENGTDPDQLASDIEERGKHGVYVVMLDSLLPQPPHLESVAAR
jgi:hypothetical protein